MPRCQDHRDRDHTSEVGYKGPIALGRAAEQKRRNMPQGPNAAEDKASPKWVELALQQWERKTSPAKLYDGSKKQCNHQCREDLVPGEEGKWIADGSFQRSTRLNDQQNAQYEEQPPRGRGAPSSGAGGSCPNRECRNSSKPEYTSDTGYIDSQDEQWVRRTHFAKDCDDLIVKN